MVKKFFRDHTIHKKIVPFLDYFFLLRPSYFFNIWLLFCAGMFVVQILNNPAQIWGIKLSFNSLLYYLELYD